MAVAEMFDEAEATPEMAGGNTYTCRCPNCGKDMKLELSKAAAPMPAPSPRPASRGMGAIDEGSMLSGRSKY